MNQHIQGFRLSPQQRRAWSLASSDTTSGRAQATAVLEGALDVARLEEAIVAVVERNEILRTSFHRLPGMQFPLQVIEASFRPTLTVLSADAGAPDAWTAPIAAGATPSLAVTLRPLAADRHELVISASVLCADAAGLERAIRAIADAYAGEGDEADDALQYAVVSDWLNETLESDDAEAGKRFWQGQ